MTIIEYPYNYVVLHKPTSDQKDVTGLILWYHPKTKKIIFQESSLKNQCSQCKSILDITFIGTNLGHTLSKLLVVGWKEVKRG